LLRHLVLGADDLETARVFYDATFETIGVPAAQADAKGRLLYRHQGVLFIVGHPINGQPASHANGGTVGFLAPSPEAVKAWYAIGLTHGGVACEGEPEHRISPGTGRGVWGAYLRDPAGNKLCAAWDEPQ